LATGSGDERQQAKQPWEPFRLVNVGHISEVLQSGGGKVSTMPADPGEERKPKPINPET
jgi:hypothetical protein